ncbi:MAG: hypothetical protein ING89_00030 [Rubrivivax sp.]|nr:hypothetical protein [Rubrivivax sp.]
MLRGLVVVLLLANGLYFAWAQGWLGAPPRHAEREPRRLAAQVAPDAVTVLPPARASAALQAAREAALRCVEAGPYEEPALGQAEYRLAEALVAPDAVERRESSTPARWIVFGGRYPEAGTRSAREENLRRLGLSFERLTSPAELAPGFVLSRHDSREAAESWLKDKAPKALRGARVVALPGRSEGTLLRVPRLAAEQADKLIAVGFRPCSATR